MLKIEIETDSAAFSDDPQAECARILGKLAERLVDRGEWDGETPLMDYNGNHAGRAEWSFTAADGGAE